MGKDKMSLGEKLAYSVGGAGVNCTISFVSAFLTYYLTNSVGMSAAVAGNIVLFSRVFDAFSDIGMGTLIDRSHFKMGKARPWILMSVIPSGIALTLLFTVPSMSANAQWIYAFIMYNLVTTVFGTSINVPSVSLNALATDSPKERSTISIMRMTICQLAMLLVQNFALVLVDGFGGEQKGWTLTAALLGVLSAVFLAITALGVKERTAEQAKEKTNTASAVGSTLTLGQKLSIMFHNKNLLLVAGTTMLTFIAVGTSAGNIYYAQYILGDRNLVGALAMAKILPGLVAMLLLLKVSAKLSKKKMSLYGQIIAVAGGLFACLNAENYTLMLIGLIIMGIGNAPLSSLQQAMVADSITYSKNNCAGVEGMSYGLNSFAMKFGTGMGAAIVGWLLAAGGFAAQAEVQSAATILAIKSIVLYIPVACAVIIIIMLLGYNVQTGEN